jgi:hypothetical protein
LIHEMFLEDSAILGKDAEGQPWINWKEWHGERVIYRSVSPERLDWRQLPEIVVLLEPIIGERIVFNPYPKGIQSPQEAQERVRQIWLDLYGRAPERVLPALPFPQVLDLLSQSLKAAGNVEESGNVARVAEGTELLERGQLAPEEARAAQREVGLMLNRLEQRDAGILGRSLPFAIEGGPHSGAPFLLIEDGQCFDKTPIRRVDSRVWRNGPATRESQRANPQDSNATALIIYMGPVGSSARTMLPAAYLFEEGDGIPRIRWNNVKDLDESKLIHTSSQAFYLRRYARRVAELWQKEYGRRPRVHALTRVSLNGRPYQELVDPNVDLADVSVKWFRHNDWIRELQTSRIPRAALASETVVAK